MISLLKKYPHILLFGILQIVFTAPGQTFLISLFVGPIFSDLNLSISLFAGLYSIATVLAALLLNPVGRLIDKMSLRPILFGMTSLMAIGCFMLANASTKWELGIAFFLLRFIGQGGFGLAASTIITKTFHKNRGKALSLITLGFPLSEIIYPFLSLLAIQAFGWQFTYVLFGVSTLVLMVPIQFYLIHKAKIQKAVFYPEEIIVQAQRLRGTPETRVLHASKDYTLKAVLKDPIFYCCLLASAVPPVVMTGLFFHQNSLFLENQWPISLAATGLSLYALFKAIFALGIGPTIDKQGPIYPFASLVAMIGLGTLIASSGGPVFLILIYFSILGAALGMSAPVMNCLWALLYGTKHIGSIKGFIGTFRNGITAFGPLPIAILMDDGFSIQTILYVCSGVIFFLAIIPILVQRFDPRLSQSHLNGTT
ncbi:hypothetical protein DID77_04290 [Candidatus Marinamargulisbacteria bacterium SCGC AG-439-L15]|nr:hypothetical protein DID77_04290 [Candidatus Marinamargulisbacteria bacterium SCGC AG-439-L15]